MATSSDPTASTVRRESFASEFRGRWDRVYNSVGRVLDDRDYQPATERVADSVQVADFRDRLEGILGDHVVDPTPHRAVRRGRHYTAAYVRELYRHGIDHADDALRAAGWEFDAPNSGVAIEYAPHDDALARQYVGYYQDVEDAARGAEQEAVRAYRRAVDRSADADSTLAVLVGERNPRGRLRAVGEYRTGLVAKAKPVELINIAALYRYRQVGVETLGVSVETRPGGESGGSDGSASTTDATDAVGASAAMTRGTGGEHGTAGVTVESMQPAAPGDADTPHEWETAGDELVCDECASLAGIRVDLADVLSGDAPMPVRDTHLNCRCFYVPDS